MAFIPNYALYLRSLYMSRKKCVVQRLFGGLCSEC